MEFCMLQNNNGRVIRHIVKSSLMANKLRNRFMGMVIILSAFLLSFSSTFGFNAFFDVKSSLQSVNIESSGGLSEMSISIVVIAVIIFFACVLAVYDFAPNSVEIGSDSSGYSLIDYR